MTHPLEKKIGRLRGRLRLLAAARAVGWLTAAAVGGVGLLGAVDYWIRFKDGGMRVICTLAFLALLAWVCRRVCYRRFFGHHWRELLSSLSLAQKVEDRFPQLGDSLASSIEFLQQPENDLRAGSPVLRRAVIAETTAKTEGLKFTDAVDARPARRAVIAAAAMCLLAAAMAVVDPLWLQVAVARLAYPLGNVNWPQKTHLELVERVERVAAGGSFEVEAKDSFDAKLPTDAKIFYRLHEPDGGGREQVESMRHLGRVLQARRENVTAPFAYRITGGDDRSMEWIEVEVVEPPAVKSLSLHLAPPQYTGWPTVTVDENQTSDFRVLDGTSLVVQAAVNKPIKSVEMRLGEDKKIPGRVSEDGMTFVVPAGEKSGPGLVIEHSCSLSFEMIDHQGLRGGGDLRWDIRAIEDRPPTVSIEQPSETVYATPQATLPLAVLVKDDLAVARVELVAQLEKSTGNGKTSAREDKPPVAPSLKIVLFAGPPQPAAAERPASDEPIRSGGEGESRRIEFRWELEQLELDGRRPQPGWTVVFHAAAQDYKPLEGRSDARRLIIVAPDEMIERIAARQQFILAELTKVLAMQRDSSRQVGELAIRLEESGRFNATELDRLRRAELAQREVEHALTAADEGVRSRIRQLLDSLENNRLDSPEVQRRMGGLLAEIDRLAANNLAVIAAEMTSAVKSARVDAAEIPADAAAKTGESDATALNALRIVEKNQASVVESLERMLGSLCEWDDYRRFHAEIGQLIRKQDEIMRRSTDLGGRTLGKSLADLSPQEAAELRIAAGDQAESARQLDRIAQGMTQMADKLDRNDPLPAETLRDAVHCAARRAIAARMRSAGDNLGQNRIAQATSEQNRIVDDLQEVLDILANRRENELVRLVKRLREAEAELAELAARQNDAAKRFDAAAAETDAAKRRQQLEQSAAAQKSLQEETLRSGRRLERLLAQQAGERAAEAAKAMGRAAENAEKSDAQAAKEQAREALKSLQEAADSLAQRRRQAESELAGENMTDLADALLGLERRQQKAVEETVRLDSLRPPGGDLDPGQQAASTILARGQAALAQDTGLLAEKTDPQSVFRLALTGAAAKMEEAARRLGGGETGPRAQEAERQAQQRLAQILDALKSAKDEQDKSSGGGGGAPGGKGGGERQGQEVKLLAQLKLFKMLQQEIHERTLALQQQYGVDGQPPQQLDGTARRAYAELAAEQRRLADTMLQLLPAKQQ